MSALLAPEALAEALHRGQLAALPAPCGWLAVGRAGERAALLGLDPGAAAGLALTGGDPERLRDFLPAAGLRAQRLVERLLPGPVALRLGATGPLIRLPAAAGWKHLAACTDPLLCVVLQDHGQRLWPVAEVAQLWPQLVIAGAVDADARSDECRLVCARGSVTVLQPGAIAAATLRTASALRLLCVCTGNTCRSPMLAALLRAELGRRGLDGIVVDSAGTAAEDGTRASAGACQAMSDRQLALDRHRSHATASLNLTLYDRIYCMSRTHAAHLRHAGIPAERLAVVNDDHGGVPDPFGGSQADYDACARVLEQAAGGIADEL